MSSSCCGVLFEAVLCVQINWIEVGNKDSGDQRTRVEYFVAKLCR